MLLILIFTFFNFLRFGMRSLPTLVPITNIGMELLSQVPKFPSLTLGVPAINMGRTKHIAGGFTYGMMDLLDYYIEECEGTKCRRGDQWVDIQIRKEVILRKGDTPVTLTVLRTDRGLLEVKNGTESLPRGFYLARGYIHDDTLGIPSAKAVLNIWGTKTVAEAQKAASVADISANFIFVDHLGNLGYQQTGSLPKRPTNSLYPLLAWESPKISEIHPPSALKTIYNPPEGFIVTANDEQNPLDGPLGVTFHMGNYRSDRISEMLQKAIDRDGVTLDDFKRIQRDLESLQARRFMKVLRPWLNSHVPSGKEETAEDILVNWDCRYNADSKGAVIFERFYANLTRDVFGKVTGWEAWEILSSSPFFAMFDQIILDYSPASDELLWKGETQEQLFRRVADTVLGIKASQVPTYNDERQVVMTNVLFSGQFGIVGRILGIDYGPFPLEGNRATISQGVLTSTSLRLESFGVSWRFITDIATSTVESILPGGPSGRPFSGLYSTEVEQWRTNEYKKFQLE